MNEKQFLKNLREAVRKLKPKPVLDAGCRLRFILRDGDGAKYCPITLVCIHQKGIYYSPSYEVRKAARLIKVRATLREEINRAADCNPSDYDKALRRKLMRAAGLWK